MGSDHDQSGPAESEFAVRLAVIKDIAQTMRDPQSPGDIMQAAVDSLHVRFLNLRAAYSTVSQDGQISVDRLVGPEGWPGPRA